MKVTSKCNFIYFATFEGFKRESPQRFHASRYGSKLKLLRSTLRKYSFPKFRFQFR